MTMDIRNLTPEQKAMILQAGKEGFSAGELRELGLNRQVAEALYKSLAGEVDEVGDKAGFLSDKENFAQEYEKVNAEAKARKKEYKDNAKKAFKDGDYLTWLKESWNHAKAPNGAYQTAKSPLMGALPFVVALVVTSCSDMWNPNGHIIYTEDELKEIAGANSSKEETNIINIVNVTNNITVTNTGMKPEDFALIFTNAMDQVIKAINDNGDKVTDKIDVLTNNLLSYLKGLGLESLSAIKQLVEQLVLTNNANQEEIKAVLDEINKKLDDIALSCKTMMDDGKTIHEIVTLLKEQNVALADIIAALNKNNVALGDVITALQNNGESLDLIITELNKNGYALSDIRDLLVQNNVDNAAILEAINNIIGYGNEVGKKLDEIVTLLKTGIVMDQETHDILNEILDAMDALQASNESVDTINIEKTLAAILEAITKLPTKDNVKEMNDENKELFESLVSLVKEFIAQEKAMDQDIINLITNFANSFDLFVSYEKIADKELKDTLSSLKNEVIEAIKNIKVKVEGNLGGNNVTVDLSSLEKMVAQMLEKMSSLPTADQLNANQKEMLASFEALTKLLNTFMVQENANDLKTQELIENLSVAFDLFAAGEQIRDKELRDIVENLKLLIENFANQENVANTDMLSAINEVLKAVKNIKINVEGGGGTINVDLSAVEEMMAKMIEMMAKMPTAEQMDANQKEMLSRFEDLTKLLNSLMDQENANDAKTQELIANLSVAFDLFATGEQIRDEELKTLVANLSAFVEKFAEQEKLADEKSLEAINNVLEAVKNLKIKVDGDLGGNVTVDLSGVETALASILAAINNLPTKDNMIQMNDDLIKAINDLTALVNSFMENEAKMDEKEQALAQKILDAISNLNLEAGDVTVNVDLSKLEAMMSILVEKAGKLDATTEAILEAVLNGNKDFGEALDEIKDLIMVNNNIAQGTQDLVAKLGDKLDGLGEGIKEILLKILDEEQKQNVTSAEMLKVLNAIKNATDENGDTLLRIEEKLNLVAQSINVLLEDLPEMHEATKALLIQILDKIPAACNCNIDEVIAKLEIIIIELQKNPSNEGIVDDLDDLLQ